MDSKISRLSIAECPRQIADFLTRLIPLSLEVEYLRNHPSSKAKQGPHACDERCQEHGHCNNQNDRWPKPRRGAEA